MKASSALRVVFGLECLIWLMWLAFDLVTVSAQLEIAHMIPLRGMPIWIALSLMVNLALVIASAIGVRHGRGAFSRKLQGGAQGALLAAGIVFRILLGLAMAVWLTTMSGAQSV